MHITKQEKENRKKAREIITLKVIHYAKLYSFKFNRIAIRNQKTRLGSCSSKGNLNFNWQIIKFPEEAMNYVIIHELCHLKHHNHSKNYWNEVAKIMPDYKIHHKWIRKNSHSLIK